MWFYVKGNGFEGLVCVENKEELEPNRFTQISEPMKNEAEAMRALWYAIQHDPTGARRTEMINDYLSMK